MAHRTCSVEECPHQVVSRGWCHKHYVRWRRHGDPLRTNQPKRDGYPDSWLHSKIVVSDSGCWEWQGTIDANGYGVVRGSFRAHQLTFTRYVGPVPEGLEIDHLCRNRACCNPQHLEAVTHQENLRRAAKARPRRTHCVRGHEWSETNTRVCEDGRRCCRSCEREKAAEQRRRAKATKENSK